MRVLRSCNRRRFANKSVQAPLITRWLFSDAAGGAGATRAGKPLLGCPCERSPCPELNSGRSEAPVHAGAAAPLARRSPPHCRPPGASLTMLAAALLW